MGVSDQDICKSLASEHTLHDWSLHTSHVLPVMLIHGQFDTKFSFPNKYGDQTFVAVLSDTLASHHIGTLSVDANPDPRRE
jgi:hypothetical protein